MPVLTFDIKIDPVPTVKVWVSVYKAKDEATLINFVDFDPPHINPRGVQIYVPTYDVYLVKIYEGGTDPTNGIFLNDFVVRPSADIASIPKDIYLEVGRGQPQDPANGAGFILLPGTEGMNISRIDKVGVGPLPPEEWEQISGLDVGGNPVIGVDLLDTDDYGNPIVFNQGERFRVVFEISVDGNAGDALLELSDRLDEHIDDTNNPHGVTKNQVGLGNIPNAVSDNWQAPSSGVLATTQAVFNAFNSIADRFLSIGVSDLFTINAQTNVRVTVTHNLGLNNYLPIATLKTSSNSSTFPGDNHTSWAIRQHNANSIEFTMANTSNSQAQFYIYYFLIKF